MQQHDAPPTEAESSPEVCPPATSSDVAAEAVVVDVKQVALSDVLFLLLDTLQRKDLFDIADRSNLRLVSREIRQCLDVLAPITAIRIFVDQFPKETLPLRPILNEKVKILDLANFYLEFPRPEKTGLDSQELLEVIKWSLPAMESLRIASEGEEGDEIIVPHLIKWPSLTQLEICHSGSNKRLPKKQFLAWRRKMFKAWRNLGRKGKVLDLEITFPRRNVCSVLGNLTTLTKLDLTDHVSRVSYDEILLPKALPNLKDLTVSIRHSDLDSFDSAPMRIPNFQLFSSAPKLRRLDFHGSDDKFTGRLLSEIHNMSFVTQLEALNFSLPSKVTLALAPHAAFPEAAWQMHMLESIALLPRYSNVLPALGSALTELTIHNWRPELVNFSGIRLPSLKKLKFENLKSLACHQNLLEAVLPKLETLTLHDWNSYDYDEVTTTPSSLSHHSVSPFPSLKTLKYSSKLSNTGIQLIELLLPSVVHFELHFNNNSLEQIFAQRMMRNLAEQQPVWSCLSSLHLQGAVDGSSLDILRKLRARAPALTALRVVDTALSLEKIEHFKATLYSLYEAGILGSWYRIKFEYFYTYEFRRPHQHTRRYQRKIYG